MAATNDTGDAGRLILRDGPSTSATMIGTIPASLAPGERNSAAVTVRGPAESGFTPVTYNGQDGYVWSGYLQAVVPAAAPILTTGDATLQPMQVTTASDPLNLRRGPSTGDPVITTIPKGTIVQATGPDTQGFTPITWPDKGISGFGATQYLTAVDAPAMPSMTAGYIPVFNTPGHVYRAGYRAGGPHAGYRAGGPHAGYVPQFQSWGSYTGYTAGFEPSKLPADLQDAAHELKSVLDTRQCHAADEPLVSRFQKAATSAGLYRGNPHGAFDPQTLHALQAVVGPVQSPPCFDHGGQGGPVNHDNYWAPVI